MRASVDIGSGTCLGPEGEPAVSAGTEEHEAAFLTHLQDGDEAAFNQLVDRYYTLTLNVARSYVRSQSVAEEVAQEAWIGVIRGLHRFEGRSSLKNWIVRIVVNIARTLAAREARSLPFSALAGEDDDGIDPSRFRDAGDPLPGHWTSFPRTWPDLPDEAATTQETLAFIEHAIEALPEMQRLVITLRDIHAWDSAEIAAELGLTDSNERVLLHRARTKVRAALETHLSDE